MVAPGATVREEELLAHGSGVRVEDASLHNATTTQLLYWTTGRSDQT